MTLPQGFELEITFPDQSPQRFPLESKLSIGGSDKSELCIEDYGLSPLHLSFRIHNAVLSLHNLGGKKQTLLGEQVLNHGKMYLLNFGDIIKVGDIDIKICEYVATAQTITEDPQPIDNPKEVSELDDKTAPGFKFDSMTADQVDEAELEEDDEYEEFTDEEFDYEDQRPGLFQRIKNKFKRKEKEEIDHEEDEVEEVEKEVENPRDLNIKKSAGKKITIPAPGPFIRLFSILANIALCFTLANDILPHFGLEGIFTSLYTAILPELNKVPQAVAIVEQVFNVLVCYFIIEFVSSILLGVNFCQYIFGFRSKNGFIVSRIQAPIRMFIGYFTASALIFDIPCIFRKRTFKEFITGSQLFTKSKFYTILIIILIFPLILFSPIYTPIVINIDSFDRVNTSEISNVKIKKESKIQRSWPSHSLGLKYLGKWDKSFNILPATSKGKIVIYNSKNINALTISKEKEYDLKKQLELIIKRSPIFKIQYKSLFNFYSSKENKPMSKNAIKDYSKLVLHALSLSFEELPVIMTSHGPFLKDLYFLKTEIMKRLDHKKNSTINYYITNKKIVLHSTTIGKVLKKTSLIVIDEQGIIKTYKTYSKKKDSKYQNKLTNLFFRNINPIKDGDIANAWDWVKIDNLFTAIKKVKRDITDLEIASIYDFYYNLASEQIKVQKTEKNKENNLAWFSKILFQASEKTKNLSNSGKLSNIEELSQSLKKLAIAVEKNKVDFFSLE